MGERPGCITIQAGLPDNAPRNFYFCVIKSKSESAISKPTPLRDLGSNSAALCKVPSDPSR